MFGREEAGDEAQKLKWGQSWTRFFPRFRGPRRGWKRGAIPYLWRDLHVLEVVGCPADVCCGLTGEAAWTSTPGYRLIRLLISKRVT